MNPEHQVIIIPFSSDLKEPIKTLNIEWLNKYFKIEPKDERVLSNPQEEIIDKGGMIFYAKYKDAIVGTVSLLKMNDTIFELSKMAVTDSVQGLGIGKKLMEHCIKAAEENHIEKIIIYSNRRLVPAISLYRKFGFEEIPVDEGIYERADIKMEKLF
ncbi:GNAT family N-acetyltransferase [Flavobacterium sp. ALD4]|uniref:GNAT family N-acetyltransferase n=1 Tax=Flavobacterium sp. ALD4 TaxID=2058314 RepID=UPI000C339BC4|nr:GNAT family N-acetyltransferase [Flavobacterium sp. ALD4]PKH68366.1 GNAT family N-acetyltransferase [Flavobacterium sp. ALD4]